MEADVLLEVSAQLVTVEVIAETEALSGHHLIHLLLHWGGQQGLQAIWGKYNGDVRLPGTAELV